MPGPTLPTGSFPPHVRSNTARGQQLNVKDYGAIGDPSFASHKISAGDVTANPQWAGRYTAGVDEWDYVGIQECIYAAYGQPGAENGLTNSTYNAGGVFIPAGKYRINKTLILKKAIGVLLCGAGRFSTDLYTVTAETPIIETDMVYSVVRDIKFSANADLSAQALFEWTWDGLAGSTAAGLQSLSVYDCEFDGAQRAYVGFRAARDLVQGDNLLFSNCKLVACTQAAFRTGAGAYNALNFHFYCCNFASNYLFGIETIGGNCIIMGGSFQDGGSGGQQSAVGADIRIRGGSNDSTVIFGARSESLRFLWSDGQHYINMIGCSSLIGPLQWAPNTAYTVGALRSGLANLDGRLYQVTVAGTSSGTEPVWAGVTVIDGGVTWALYEYDIVKFDCGSIQNCTLPYGRVNPGTGGPGRPISIERCTLSRDDWLPDSGGHLFDDSLLPNFWIFGNVVIYGGGQNQGSGHAYSFKTANAGGTLRTVAQTHAYLSAGTPLVWARYGPSGGNSARDVGFWPPVPGYTASNVDSDKSLNTVGILGTLGPRHAIGADQAGSDLYLQGGLSSGTGVAGKIKMRIGPAGTTGSQNNVATKDVLTVDLNNVDLASGVELRSVKHRVRKATVTGVAPSATLSTYGTATNVDPATGYYGLADFQYLALTSSGTFGAETLTARITFTFSDASTTTITKTFTAAGVETALTAAELFGLLTDGLAVTRVSVDAQSTIGSSAARAGLKLAARNT